MNIIDNITNDVKQKQKEFTKTLKHFMLVSCTFTAFITTGCLFSQTNNVNYAYACLASLALIFIFTAINEVKRFLEFNFLWIFCTIVFFLTMYFFVFPVASCELPNLPAVGDFFKVIFSNYGKLCQ